ncbi:MAG: aminotransferase class I/II-fold pyridoxal phosphate-dependent enzyme [Candidatus Hermodarchaeia archaeon]|jgi:glycine hydroxymethyltransferase
MCAEFFDKITTTVKTHEHWRSKCLNLIPSENLTSPQVRALLGSDFGHRYAWDEPWYGGQKYSIQIEKYAVAAAKQLYDAEYANVRPLSGHLSLMSVIMGLCQPKDTILISNFENGGYPLNLQARFPLNVHYIPYQSDQYTMDVTQTRELIKSTNPKLVILGASIFLQPHPVKELAKTARDTGTVLVFDGSHVLGLIAGKQFQNPFKEGAQILLGSTHKTFFGPQGGIILVKDDMEVAEQIDLTLRPNPVLVDNYHLNRVAALAISLAELLAFGEDYAKQVITNAKELAQVLHKNGIPVTGAHWGFTSSHQVLLKTASFEKGIQMRDQLEKADIIADAGVRLGSQEVTRRGMKTGEMREIAGFITQVLSEKEKPEKVKQAVHSLVQQFESVHYAFEK